MNLSYKRFFRPLYQAYEAGLKENLKLLSGKLTGAWRPSPPQKLFMPKPSGLLRPIGLLNLEDQIVLQAVANAYARKLRARRKAVEGSQVFSNILPTDADRSIFFLEPWQASYARFRKKVELYYSTGYRWIAHFDLSAFFDTISHDTLLTIVSPREGHKNTWDRVRDWLRAWASVDRNQSLRHGMRQEKAYWTSDKARLHERLRDLSKAWGEKAGLKSVFLDSFIISATSYDELRACYGDGSWTVQDFADKHILFFEQRPGYAYVPALFAGKEDA